MSKPVFFISGATGATGGAAARQLLAKGSRVRAFVHREDERAQALREQGAEVAIGDLRDFHAVRKALKGADRAYFVYPIQPGLIEATVQFAQAAEEAGIEAVVNMSQISARENARSNAAQAHWLAERVFDWSGLSVTHLRPTYFAEWLLTLAPMIQQGLFYGPFTTGRHAPVAAEDQARVIVGVLENSPAHRGQIYPLYGPVEMTHAEIAKAAGSVLGKEVRYQSLPFEQWAETVKRVVVRRRYDDFLLQHLREVAIDHTNGVFAGTNDLVERIGGRPPMTVEAFVEKHRDAFA
ncbi:MAG TPA: NAD(P)H-binding protein [Caulobacteraceae bacterium]|jgi:uncharacterized protein YbjT (DUF2867 family)